MKLTRRQETFIRNFLDLYRETQEPIHYSVLAERLGVSRFTAYDMLRLFEEKGLVASDYLLTAEKVGPGRSEIVFVPTASAHRLIAKLAGEIGGKDWEAFKEHLLASVRSGQEYDPELVQEMLARVPTAEQGALRYCVEVMTIVALRLRRSASRALLLDYLPQLLPARDKDCRASLSLLGGFALGVLADETTHNSEWRRELFEHVKRYQSLVADMDPKLCRQLAKKLREVFKPLEKFSQPKQDGGTL